jgi:hypothetical protein
VVTSIPPPDHSTPKGQGRRKRLAAVPDVEAELDELYGGPLDAFTATRNDLASRLRAAGQDDAAARVAELRKPSLPVWLVNQLARREPERVTALVEAAATLGAAQTGRAKETSLADAIDDHRKALQSLGDEAAGLVERPLTDDVRRRVSATLRSASLDPARRDRLRAGLLTDEGEEQGFDLVASLGVSSRRRGPGRTPAREEARRTTLRKQLDAARAELERLREQLGAANEEARNARRHADEAGARLAEIEARTEQVRARVGELEAELSH